jgi:hypothetical protein
MSTFSGSLKKRAAKFFRAYSLRLTDIGNVAFSSGENFIRRLAYSGNYVYAVTNQNPPKLIVTDISNPASPVRVGGLTFAAGTEAYGICISGTHAYVGLAATPGKLAEWTSLTLPLLQ